MPAKAVAESGGALPTPLALGGSLIHLGAGLMRHSGLQRHVRRSLALSPPTPPRYSSSNLELSIISRGWLASKTEKVSSARLPSGSKGILKTSGKNENTKAGVDDGLGWDVPPPPPPKKGVLKS